jgi:hypothetical protein
VAAFEPRKEVIHIYRARLKVLPQRAIGPSRFGSHWREVKGMSPFGVTKEIEMKAILKLSAVALAMVLVSGVALAEDAKAPPTPAALLKLMAEAGQPGAEHKKLEPFIGDWSVTVRLWTDPSQPPAEAKGSVERKWILGGRFVQENTKIDCDGKSFEGMGIIGYEKAQKKYSTVRVCGLCGSISHGLATCSESGAKFECAKEECCPVTGQKFKGRDEIVIESNDKIVVNVFRTIEGKELKVMEIVSVRK